MPSFQPPQTGGSGFGGFNFTAGSESSNPFAQQQNGTPPPTTNPFGQQNGNAGSSFGSTFGSANQPQQNGFNPPASSLFSNQTNNNAATPSFGFGQSNQTTQPQQNGVTPSTATTSSFPSFGKQNNDNPFKNFPTSQQTQETQSTPSTSFGGFGTQQTNGENPPATPKFGGFGQQSQHPNGQKTSLFSTSTDTPKTTTGSVFSSFGQQQQNGGNKPEETPKTTTGSIFSGQQQNSTAKGLFGSTPPPERASTPGGGSVLTGLDSARASTISQGMFTQNKSGETPKPSSAGNLFSFGQQSQQNGEETPKASSTLFSGSQPNGVKSNMFGGTSTSQSEQQTPAKQTTGSIFSGAFGGQQQQGSTTPKFSFGQSQNQQQQDTSMTTPGNTPQKPANMFAQANAQPAASSATEESNTSAPSETPMGQGKSSFDRISRDEPPATAQKTLTPAKSLFNMPAPSPATTNKENEAPSTSQGKSLFERVWRDEPPPTAQKQPSFAPSNNLFNKPAETAAPSAAPWLSHTSPLSAPPSTQVTPPTPQPPATAKKASAKTTTMSETISESERNTFKVLNEGLSKHLATQDPNVDWTTIMEYYLQQAANIRKKPEPKFDAPAPAASVPAPAPASTASAPAAASANEGSAMTGKSLFMPQGSSSTSQAPNGFSSGATNSTNLFSSASTPKAPTSNSTSTNMFAAANSQQQVQTPKQPSSFQSNNSQPPATAPVSKKRRGPFEEDDDDADRQPATEKRARVNEPISYPKLPDNASETAKLFQAALDKPTDASKDKDADAASATAGFKPHSSGSGGPAPSDGFKPLSSGSGGLMPLGGFKLSSSSTPSGAATTPSGMPTFSAPTAGSGGFLASFGKKANEEEEKEKKKRKLEDYESDEETEEDWAKRDKEEQEAKRQKILEEGKKAGGFVFNAGGEKAGDSSNIFGNLSKSSASVEDKDKAEPEKEQGPGDNTWNVNTPIKFGGSSTSGTDSTTPAAPPPVFGNLFGSSGQTPATSSSSTTGHLNVPAAKPAIGFNFGVQPTSLATSRATTPGATTDGEGASTAGEGEDEEALAPSDQQVEDQTGVQKELEHEDLLFTLPSAKGMKHGDKKSPNSGEITQGWVDKALGPLYILKNKETGKTRVLLKIPPMGHPGMNFEPIKNLEYKVVQGKKTWYVQGPFMDRLANKEEAKLSRWLVDVETQENAEEVVGILMENRSPE